MHKLLQPFGRALLLILLLTSAAHAQTAPPLTIPPLADASVLLEGPWQFHLGDSPTWASPNLDDSAWEPLTVDQPWGQQTHFAYSGFAWYRRHLHFANPNQTPLALLLPPISTVYQVFWNGKPIARFGTMPPNPSWHAGEQRQIVTLPAAQDGVLALRVWQSPYLSGDTGNSGGPYAAPRLGNPAAIADRQAALSYAQFKVQVVNDAINTIPIFLFLIGLFSWLQDRSRKVVFWMTLWAFGLLGATVCTGLHIPWPAVTAIAISQPLAGLTDIALWFLLLYLLELDHKPRLVQLVRVAAVAFITFQVLDALTIEFLWTGPHIRLAQVLDFLFTLPELPFQIIPLILIGFGLGKRLSLPRWLVACFGAATQLTAGIANALEQGQRFTHWTIGPKLQPLQTSCAAFLFGSIIYAVWRYSVEQRAHQSALEQEFKSAQELQRVLIPESLPPIPGYALTSAYKPAQQVGGDFFQVIAKPDQSTLVLLGDVSGKGLTAAMTVSLIVGTIRTLAETTSDPALLLAGLNRRLHGRLQHGFATCLALHLQPTGACTLANAGHLSPFLNLTELQTPPALPLGLDPTATYESIAVQLEVRSRLTLFTDGLLEARKPTGELFGFDRLNHLMGTAPDAAQAVQTAVAFGQDDDITVLTLTRLATGITSTTTLSAPTLTFA
jgi:hypothetical protein